MPWSKYNMSFFLFPALETAGSHAAAIVSQAFTKQLSQYTNTLK